MSAKGVGNGKSHICSIDKRRFSTKAALQQHIADSHKKSPQQNRTSYRGRGRGRGGRSGSVRNAFTAAVPTTSGSSIVVSGEDRVLSFLWDDKSDAIKSIPINIALTPRLETLAKAYQKVEWMSLVFYISPKSSTLVNGGYVSGIVMDPEDIAVTIEQVSASQGSRQARVYESTSVRMPSNTFKYYTSLGQEPRFTSPGTFWFMTDGVPGSAVQVTVMAHWKVRLHSPSYEAQQSFVLSAELVPIQNNYNLSWVRKDGTKSQNFSSIVPTGLDSTAKYHFWRVPSFTIEYKEGAGDTGSITAHFIAYSPSDTRMYYSCNGSDIVTTMWQGDVDVFVAVPCGTLCKYAGSGNPCGPSLISPSSRLTESGPSPSELTRLIDSLNLLMSTLPQLSKE